MGSSLSTSSDRVDRDASVTLPSAKSDFGEDPVVVVADAAAVDRRVIFLFSIEVVLARFLRRCKGTGTGDRAGISVDDVDDPIPLLLRLLEDDELLESSPQFGDMSEALSSH
jgi:hypothetical protein